MAVFDVVLSGGRLIDPETGLDAVGSVGLVGGEIREVVQGGAALEGNTIVDCTGLVVCPGFIDTHA